MPRLSFPSLILSPCIAIMALLSLSACSSDAPDPDTIWDIAPTEIYIALVDEEGTSLLNSDSIPAILASGMYMDMDGTRYDVSDRLYQTLSGIYGRYIPALPYGLQLIPDNYTNMTGGMSSNLILMFGQFARDETYSRDFVLDVPYASRHYSFAFRLSNKFQWKKGKPDITTRILLDGKEITDFSSPITLTIPTHRP